MSGFSAAWSLDADAPVDCCGAVYAKVAASGGADAPLPVVIWISPWAALATWLGIIYEPALLFVAAIGLCIAMILYLTVVISGLMQRHLRLAQELALLRARLDERDGRVPG